MKTLKALVVPGLILALVLAAGAGTRKSAFPELTGPYLGQKLPGLTPEIFAPGVIGTGLMERDITITPDGKEIYYGLFFGNQVTIMVTRLHHDRWTEPEIAPFAADLDYFHIEPCLSADGQRIFFLCTRPPKGMEPKPRWSYQNIWAADRKADGSWKEPYELDAAINDGEAQFYPSLTSGGTIYFTRTEKKSRKTTICRSRQVGGKFLAAEPVPIRLDAKETPYNAFISRDESFLIVPIDGRACDANPGYANYFVFFRDEGDRWSEGIPFGPEVNIKGSNAMSASVSPDGKFLFFAAQKTADRFTGTSRGNTLSRILEMVGSSQNGDYDIYWVDAKIIAALRPRDKKE